jgi:vacuole morphology and inheritance protein 14
VAGAPITYVLYAGQIDRTCAEASDFRSVQTRHEKARRRHMDGEFGSVSSAHYSSPSQTWTTGGGTALGTGPAPTGTSKASSTLRRKVGSGSTSRERQSSVDAAGGGKNSLSPMNPRRTHPGSGSGSGAGGLMSPGVSLGGAVASMNSTAGLGAIRPGSPPSSNLAARRRLLGGIRKSAGQGT